jgi:putative two-component system response regulator
MVKKRSKRNRDDQVRKAYRDLKKAHQEIKEAHMAIVLRLAIIAEYRDPDTGAHIMRISDYGCEMCKGMGMSEEEIEVYRFASPLHDIGKIGIVDAILKKEGRLTPEEFKVMETHAIIGARMFDGSKSPILSAASDICRGHHEKWDGKGYPDGVKGEKIPLFARIVSVVDVFDAITSKRCYKEAWPFEESVRYIKTLAGNHLDPHLVSVFIKVLPKIRHIYKANKEIQTFISDYDILSQKFNYEVSK